MPSCTCLVMRASSRATTIFLFLWVLFCSIMASGSFARLKHHILSWCSRSFHWIFDAWYGDVPAQLLKTSIQPLAFDGWSSKSDFQIRLSEAAPKLLPSAWALQDLYLKSHSSASSVESNAVVIEVFKAALEHSPYQASKIQWKVLNTKD